MQIAEVILRCMTVDPIPVSPKDVVLLERFRSGDGDAALQLYLRYADRLLRVATKQTATELSTRFDPEDIVQSVFRTFFRRAASGQYDAPEGDELWKLLLVMALNKVRSRAVFHRSEKRDIRKTQSIQGEHADAGSESQDIARSILYMSIDEIIQRQPESHRGIIRLRIDGLDVQSIAERESRSKRTVERVLQSFRTQLMEAALIDIGSERS